MISALSLLVPAASFAQVEQQQSQQQTRSQSRQDQQTQQSRYGPGQGQQQASITSDVQVTSQGELSEEERRSLSLAAGRLLKHVHQARQAIHQQQKQQAMGHIDKGLTLAQIIESAVPTHEVTARIQSGDMTYEDKERVKQLIVPIYTELEKVTLMAPLRAGKQEAAKNGGSARELSPGKPSQQSPSARPSQPSQPAMTPVVAGVEVHHTHIMLDVSAAKEHLRAAKQALNNDKDEAADGALAAVQRGVSFAYIEADLPLLRARENLMLAKAQVQAGQVQDARATLEAAAQALERYGQYADRSRASQVQSLQREIQN